MKLTIACVIAGAAIGYLFIPVALHPGGSGRSIAAGLGGFAGLIVGLFATAVFNLFGIK